MKRHRKEKTESRSYPGALTWNDRRRQWGRLAVGRTINNRTLLPRRK